MYDCDCHENVFDILLRSRAGVHILSILMFILSASNRKLFMHEILFTSFVLAQMLEQQNPLIIVIPTVVLQEVVRYLLGRPAAQTSAPTPEPSNTSLVEPSFEEPVDWHFCYLVWSSAGSVVILLFVCCCFCYCKRDEQPLDRVQPRGLRLQRDDGPH